MTLEHALDRNTAADGNRANHVQISPLFTISELPQKYEKLTNFAQKSA
jgi:hypothetical protein